MFSELVDNAIRISGRPNALDMMVRAANSASRVISRQHDWDWDSVEETIPGPILPNVNYVSWEPANGQHRFIHEHAVLGCNGCPIQKLRPGARMSKYKQLDDAFYYPSGNTLQIKANCWPAQIYYYEFRPWLKYYAKGARPAEFDPATGWNGAAQSDIDLVSHWQLEKMSEILLNGTLQLFFGEMQSPRQKEFFTKFSNGINEAIRSHSTARQRSL